MADVDCLNAGALLDGLMVSDQVKTVILFVRWLIGLGQLKPRSLEETILEVFPSLSLPDLFNAS